MADEVRGGGGVTEMMCSAAYEWWPDKWLPCGKERGHDGGHAHFFRNRDGHVASVTGWPSWAKGNKWTDEAEAVLWALTRE